MKEVSYDDAQLKSKSPVEGYDACNKVYSLSRSSIYFHCLKYDVNGLSTLPNIQFFRSIVFYLEIALTHLQLYTSWATDMDF